MLKQIRGKLYLPGGPELGKVDPRRLWEETIVDLGCERYIAFGLAQVGGKGIAKLGPGRAREGKSSQLVVWFGFHMMKNRRSKGRLWSDCEGQVWNHRRKGF